MKILILGHTRSGKTETVRILGKILRIKTADSTSKYIIRDFAQRNSLLPEKVLADKETYRKQLYEYALARQKEDAAYPVSEALQEADVVSGVRTKNQLDAVRHLFDKVIWINRPGISAEFSDPMTMNDAKPDRVIENDGTLEDLEKKLTAILL
jgi:dephospho-CoA kinase